MKRILSLVMSVLMIATMFCGLAVTSNAKVDYNPAEHSTNADGYIAKINSVVTDNGDGTYDVAWYMDDYSKYGWHQLEIAFDWDENVECQIQSRKFGEGTVSVYDVYTYAVDTCGMSMDGSFAYDGTKFKPTNHVISTTASVTKFALTSSAAGAQVAFNANFIENMIGGTLEDFGGVEGLGFPVGSATFALADGATSGTVSASVVLGNIAVDDSTGEYSLAVDYAQNSVTTIGSTSEEPETPALPEGITLEVQAGVSARTADPAGLRFTSVATATDWSNVSEMGTAIVVKGTTPGVDTTLVVPARVDIGGNYLHTYTKNEDGLYVFDDGVVTEKASVTYTGVISNIKDANKDVEFEAYAYIIVDGETYYSANSESASYNEIFEAAAADPTIAE